VFTLRQETLLIRQENTIINLIAAKDVKFIFKDMEKRIVELKIDDLDMISGVDQISLVDEPAIEYNWLAFKKESHDFHVPDGEDHKFLEFLKDKGETEEDLKKDGWVLTRANVVGSNQFSDPNGTSVEDTDEVRIRYRYGLAPNISGSPIISTTRDFCKSLVNENRVYRLEDIQSLPSSPENPGGNAIWYRGGYNCRHFWYQLEYQPEGRIINKASIERGRIPDTPAYGDANLDQRGTVTTKTLNNPKPSTVRNLGLSKEKFTLPLFEREEDAIDYSKLIDCQEGAHPHEIEGVTLWMPCASHPEELGYDVGGLPPYVDECPDCEKKKKKEFETYNDYPKQASENAKVALRYAEENGWGSCGTDVGKQRANQLAKGENISEETIARMAAFERHRQNSDKELGDGCGRLMWLAWGGDAGIEWAQRKLESIRKEEMGELEDACWPGYEAIGTKIKDGKEVPNCVPIKNKKVFSTDEEKREVVGPAMIVNKEIFRRDEKGNPYYVFFSEETIKQIAEKFMRRGYTVDGQHDINHRGPGEKDVYVTESWIIEDPSNDKANMYGFTDLPKGTWMVKMKILNDSVWKDIKSGKLNGFSVSGYFEEYEVENRAKSFLEELAQLLK
jgi:hypothetical protein